MSVLNATIFLTLFLIATSIIFWAPKMLVFTASNGLYSTAGTCFKAAAWIKKSILLLVSAKSSRFLSRTSPIKNLTGIFLFIFCKSFWRLNCFSSSLLKQIILFGLLFFSKFLIKKDPKEPVPPVTKIFLLLKIL